MYIILVSSDTLPKTTDLWYYKSDISPEDDITVEERIKKDYAMNALGIDFSILSEKQISDCLEEIHIEDVFDPQDDDICIKI